MPVKIIDIPTKTQELKVTLVDWGLVNTYLIPNMGMYRIYISTECAGKVPFGNLRAIAYYCTTSSTYYIDSIGLMTKDLDVFMKCYTKLNKAITEIQELIDAY